MTPPRTPLVGIVDSGGSPEAAVGARRFFLTEAGVAAGPAGPDVVGHGTQVEAVIRRALPETPIRHAQVFDDRPATSAARVAAAVRWLALEEGAKVICLSLGLPADRAVLRSACAEAIAAGAVLVAAAPAQGAPCFPAAYPGVIAATGDARCGFDQISFLDRESGPADFGAWCASPEQAGGRAGGASIGCARLTAHAARLLADAPNASAVAVAAALRAAAVHHGREYRSRPA